MAVGQPIPAADKVVSRARARRSGQDERAPGGLASEFLVWHDLLGRIRSHWVLLACLFGAALLLRLFKLGNSEVWLDEVLVHSDALAGTNEYISSAHRLHLAVVGWFLNHLGESPFFLRTWSALQGSLAVPVLAIAGLWFRDRRMGLVLGLMALLHPFLVFYSQDANYYGGMTLFASIQVCLYIAFFRGAPLISLAGILVAGLASYYNHPFSMILTLLASGGCVLGSFLYPSLRRTIYKLNPADWGQSPAMPIVIVGVLTAGPVFTKAFGRAYDLFMTRLEFGESPGNVEFSYDFFNWIATNYGVTYFRSSHHLASAAAWIPFLLFLAGLVYMASRAREDRPALPLAGLSALAIGGGLTAIFNLQHHGFYPRYLTFVIPPAIVVTGVFCLRAGEWLAGKSENHARWLIWVPLGVLFAVQIPFLGGYVFSDRGNFREMAQYLEEHWKPGEPINAIARVERHQLRYYLEMQGDTGIPVDDVHTIGNFGDYDEILRWPLLYRLCGHDTAWITCSWRWAHRPATWQFVQSLGPPIFEGSSPHDHRQDAWLMKWDVGSRALLPNVGMRVPARELADWNSWYAASKGTWNLVPDEFGEGPKKRQAPRPAMQLEPFGEGPFHDPSFDPSAGTITTHQPGRIRMKFESSTPDEYLYVTPAYPDRFVISPYNLANLPDDPRHKETEFNDLPVWRRKYDGRMSTLLWVPPHEDRQLVLRIVRRTEKYMKEKTQRETPNPDLFVSLSVDGVYQDTWIVKGSDEMELYRIPTDLKLQPGNRLLDVHVTTPRLAYKPDNPFMWGGIEFNREWEDPFLPMDAMGIGFLEFEEDIVPWGEKGSEELADGFLELDPSYHRRVSPDVIGPSGLPALEFDLDRDLSGSKDAYHLLCGPLVPIEDGKHFLGFSSYIKLEGTKTHAASLAMVLFDEEKRPIHWDIGRQQAAIWPYYDGWMRFQEIFPILREFPIAGTKVKVGYMAPGAIVFPPDPNKAKPSGRIYFDAFAFPGERPKTFTAPNLSPSLFWEVPVAQEPAE